MPISFIICIKKRWKKNKELMVGLQFWVISSNETLFVNVELISFFG